mgnify:CR=1 FL=1
MTKVNLGIIGGGQLGSLLAVAAKKLKIKTTIFCDDIDAPAKNYCDEFIFGDYKDDKIIEMFINKVDYLIWNGSLIFLDCFSLPLHYFSCVEITKKFI